MQRRRLFARSALSSSGRPMIVLMLKYVFMHDMSCDECLSFLSSLTKPWPRPADSEEMAFLCTLFTKIKCTEQGNKFNRLLPLLPLLAHWLDPLADWDWGPTCLTMHPDDWWPLSLASGDYQQQRAFVDLPIELLRKSCKMRRAEQAVDLTDVHHLCEPGLNLVHHDRKMRLARDRLFEVATIGLWHRLSVSNLRGLLDRGLAPPLLWVATAVRGGNSGDCRLTMLTSANAQQGDDGERSLICASLVLAPLVLRSEHRFPQVVVDLVTDYMVGEENRQHARTLRLQVALTIWARRMHPLASHRFAKWEQCWACRQPGFDLMHCGHCRVSAYCNRNCQQKHWTGQMPGWHSGPHRGECKSLVSYRFPYPRSMWDSGHRLILGHADGVGASRQGGAGPCQEVTR